MIGFFTPHRRLGAAIAVVALLGVPAVMALRAADHADSPDTTEGNLDVNDLYVFSEGDNMVFAMTVSPLLTPGSATNGAAFNPEGLYQFKLDVERDGVETHSFATDTSTILGGVIMPGSTRRFNRLVAELAKRIAQGV